MPYTKKEREELTDSKIRYRMCENRRLAEHILTLGKMIRNRERQKLIQGIQLKKNKSISFLHHQYYAAAQSMYQTGTIWLLRIPENHFILIENGIEDLIEHETLHLIFYRVSHKEACTLGKRLDSMNLLCAVLRKRFGFEEVWSFSDQVDFIMQWFPSQELVKNKPSAGAPSRMLFLGD